METNDLWAKFAREQIQAWTDFAKALDAAAVKEPDLPVGENLPDPLQDHPYLGHRQLQILDLPGMGDEAGLKPAEISAAIAYDCQTPI